jgi:hypothetical protein
MPASARLSCACSSEKVSIGREKAVSECLEVDSLRSPQAVLGLGLQGVHVKKLRFSLVNQNDNH